MLKPIHSIFALLALLALVPSPSLAQNNKAELFKRNALNLLNRAMSPPLNLTEFQGIPLKEVSEQIQEIQVEFSPAWRMKAEDVAADHSARTGAHYSDHYVVVVDFALDDLKDTTFTPVLALHECLGALGYSDRQYERSLALLLLVESNQKNQKRLLEHWNSEPEKLLFRTSPPRLFAEGGGTHVGGGGDTETLRYKHAVLSQYKKTGGRKWAEFMTKLQWIEIVPGQLSGKDRRQPCYEIQGNLEDGTYRIVFNNALMDLDNPEMATYTQKVIRSWVRIIRALPMKKPLS